MIMIPIEQVRYHVREHLAGNTEADPAVLAALIAQEHGIRPSLPDSRRRLSGQVNRALLELAREGKLERRGTGRNARFFTLAGRRRTEAVCGRLAVLGIGHRMTEGGEVIVGLDGLERLLGLPREEA
jgi:hypothetical protein